jgi:hypothetical protein
VTVCPATCAGAGRPLASTSAWVIADRSTAGFAVRVSLTGRTEPVPASGRGRPVPCPARTRPRPVAAARGSSPGPRGPAGVREDSWSWSAGFSGRDRAVTRPRHGAFAPAGEGVDPGSGTPTCDVSSNCGNGLAEVRPSVKGAVR